MNSPFHVLPLEDDPLEASLARNTIFLPPIVEVLKPDAQSAGKESLPRGTEALLVVEDDPAVRDLTHEMLTTQGYHVLRASNGLEGLQVARKLTEQPIGLVITDVVMPGMGGGVMAEWLKARQPHLKVLFISGYTNEAVIEWGMLKQGTEFLPKPFTLAGLVCKVRQMLDAEPPTTNS